MGLQASLARLALTLALVSTLVALATAAYGPRDAVVELTDQNFDKEVLQSGDYWLVEFYAPWCGHCQKLEPEYKAAAKKLKKHARLGAVDATANQQLAQKYQIKGYPTIKEFGAKKKRPQDYRGGRTRDEIVQYVKNSDEAKKLGVSSGLVTTLDYNAVHAFLTTKELPSAVFFGSPVTKTGKKASTKAPSWLTLVAEHFTEERKGKKRTKKVPTVQVGFVPGTDDKIAKHFGLKDTQLPTVLFVDASGSKYQAADASLKLDESSAKTFITRSLATEADATAELPSVPLFPSPEVAKKKPKVDLQVLTPRDVRKCVSSSRKQMCVVVVTPGNEEDSVRSLAKKYRRDPFAFFTTRESDPVFQALTDFVGSTEEFANTQAVVLKPGRKIKFSVLSKGQGSIDEYLDNILGGASSFSVITGDQQELEAALDASARSETRSPHSDEL